MNPAKEYEEKKPCTDSSIGSCVRACVTDARRDKHLHIARTVSVSTACTTRCRSTPFQRNVQRSAADLDQASLGSQACEDRGGGGGGGLKGSAHFALQILVQTAGIEMGDVLQSSYGLRQHATVVGNPARFSSLFAWGPEEVFLPLQRLRSSHRPTFLDCLLSVLIFF